VRGEARGAVVRGVCVHVGVGGAVHLGGGVDGEVRRVGAGIAGGAVVVEPAEVRRRRRGADDAADLANPELRLYAEEGPDVSGVRVLGTGGRDQREQTGEAGGDQVDVGPGRLVPGRAAAALRELAGDLRDGDGGVARDVEEGADEVVLAELLAELDRVGEVPADDQLGESVKGGRVG
ncbi:hypothetical protein, partial [Streptomyces sp. MB09-02B]|uniref:hypothetical protein n=1 Tax=Streptomyces sp. MB09-02B TaxID=3028667 RepID=UPI0029A2B066